MVNSVHCTLWMALKQFILIVNSEHAIRAIMDLVTLIKYFVELY